MDLTSLTGLGPARRDKLQDAGIDGIEELASADPGELSAKVDIPKATLEGFVEQSQGIARLGELEGISSANLQALVEAGITSPEQLTAEDASQLAAAAGVEVERVGGWQDDAAALTSDPRQASEEAVEAIAMDKPNVVKSAERIQEGTIEASDALVEHLSEARVVLQEGITDARVKFEDDVLAEARILPLKAREDAEEFLEDVQGNVVVLREAADDAMVRIEGRIEEGLPVFKQSLDEATEQAEQGAEEVRVRVEEIRDKEVIPRAEGLKAKVKNLLGLD